MPLIEEIRRRFIAAKRCGVWVDELYRKGIRIRIYRYNNTLLLAVRVADPELAHGRWEDAIASYGGEADFAQHYDHSTHIHVELLLRDGELSYSAGIPPLKKHMGQIKRMISDWMISL